MLVFENYTIAYRDELDKGAKFTTPLLMLIPNKCLRITGPLLESTRLEILLGTITKMHIRGKGSFPEAEYLTLDNIEKNFEEAWTKFNATTDETIVSREDEEFKDLVAELELYGLICHTDIAEFYDENDILIKTVEIDEWIPTALFLSFIKSFDIEEF